MSDQNPSDARLWAQFRRASDSPTAEPPEADKVAAYLEGRLDEREAIAVERWLADDSMARHIVLDETGATELPPLTAIRAAQAVVPRERPKRAWLGLNHLLPRPALIGAACAVCIAFYASLQLGASTYSAIQETDDRIAGAIWSPAASREGPS